MIALDVANAVAFSFNNVVARVVDAEGRSAFAAAAVLGVVQARVWHAQNGCVQKRRRAVHV
ncbi:MAG: hypothetical protein CMM87_05710 [Rickettsiales bacterium]|nr:hypothetical protein [Rickettsiales bacterium]